MPPLLPVRKRATCKNNGQTVTAYSEKPGFRCPLRNAFRKALSWLPPTANSLVSDTSLLISISAFHNIQFFKPLISKNIEKHLAINHSTIRTCNLQSYFSANSWSAQVFWSAPLTDYIEKVLMHSDVISKLRMKSTGKQVALTGKDYFIP